MKSQEKINLNLGNNISGSPMSIAGFKYSNGTGPSIYIQGGTHGGEITFPIFRLLNEFLKSSSDWSGTVTLIPISNPISWNQRSYFHTVGKFSHNDGKDWNRSFPGNPEGSISERISNLIFSEAVKHDVVIDLHTSRISNPFFIISRSDLVQHCASSGVLPIYLAPTTQSNFPLPDAIDNAGKKGFTLECGSHDSMDENNSKKCFEAILNIMRIEGLLNDSEKVFVKKDSFVYSQYKNYYSPISGFVEYLHPLEKKITKGEVLFVVYPSDNLDNKVEVVADNDCIIMKYQTTHIATIGDELVTVVSMDNIKNVA
jgi:N-alpha-acetyl-L-2,4-diaminobutyrate deacetylase